MTSLAMLLAAVNPVVSMFPQNVTFHAGFDDGTVEAAVGMTPDHPRSWKNYVLCDGLFGKALSRGMVGYQQRPEQPIVDGERPGSVVLWVRLNAEQQPRTRRLRKTPVANGVGDEPLARAEGAFERLGQEVHPPDGLKRLLRGIGQLPPNLLQGRDGFVFQPIVRLPRLPRFQTSP